MKRATPKGMAQVVLLEHDDLSDVDQPREDSSSHAADDELPHSESWWWLVLVVTREDHPLGIDDDTVGSSITAPVSTSAHVVLLDQGLSQQAAPKDGTLTRTPRARGRKASLWNRRLGPLCGEGRVARKSRMPGSYPPPGDQSPPGRRHASWPGVLQGWHEIDFPGVLQLAGIVRHRVPGGGCRLEGAHFPVMRGVPPVR